MSREKIAEIKCGKSGISLDKKALPRLEWFGKLILDYRAIMYERQFVLALLDNINDKGKVHIPIKINGTITGRCSSGDFEKG